MGINSLILQWGILKNVYSYQNHIGIDFPTAYKTTYIGFCNFGLLGGCGDVPRFHYNSLTQFDLGVDSFANAHPSFDKHWIAIGY